MKSHQGSSVGGRMKKHSAALLLLVLSSQAYADPFKALNDYFSSESQCGRLVKKKISEYEKRNPGNLAMLKDFKVELARMKQMDQLRDRAIEVAKGIEKENGGNLTLDSFFNSDKPLKERMLDRSDTYHPASGVPINEIIAAQKVKVTHNSSVGDMLDPQNSEELESQTRTWYNIPDSEDKKLVLDIDFDRPEINCSYVEVEHEIHLFKNWDEARKAYDLAELSLNERVAMGGVEEYYKDPSEATYEVEGERYKTIDGKVYQKECDQDVLAPAGRIQVTVTKDKNGKYQYETQVGETELIDQWNNSQEHADMADMLAQIGFVKRVEGYKGEERKHWYNGMPRNDIKNEAALANFVQKKEIEFDQFFEASIGAACYAEYKAGKIKIPVKKGETIDDREKYYIVQSLNRSGDSSSESKVRKNAVAIGGANQVGSGSVGSN